MFHVKQFGFLWFSALPFLPILFVVSLSGLRLLFFLFHLFTVCSIVSRETFPDFLLQPIPISPHNTHAFHLFRFGSPLRTFYSNHFNITKADFLFYSLSCLQNVSRETIPHAFHLFFLFFQFLQVNFLYSPISSHLLPVYFLYSLRLSLTPPLYYFFI